MDGRAEGTEAVAQVVDEPEEPETQDAGVPPDPAPEADTDAAGEEAASGEVADAEGELSEEEQDEPKGGPKVDPPGDDELVQSLCVLLFASPEPLTPAKLAGQIPGAKRKLVEGGLALLQERIDAAGLGLTVRRISGGYTLMTSPELSSLVAGLTKSRGVERVSAAALETLAVVAYRQPVTKAEIEAIRGVQAGPVLRSLVDRGLVKVVGRADVPGHPLQYGTTAEFLDRFGLGGLDDLPRDAELTKD